MIRNGTVPRPALLARTAAAWRAKVPGTGRLQLEIDLREKSLHIRELRIITGSSRLDDWGEGPEEQGICLAIVTLDISPKKFRFNNHKLAYASMHALGAGMSEATSNPESCC
jgi:hypothetical protein